MTIKKKPAIITVLTLCGIALATWGILHYKARHDMMEQYQNSLAERFDVIMDSAFPLLENVALSMNERTDSIEAIAKRAKEKNSSDYKEAFYNLWVQYVHSEKARKNYALLEEYEYFKVSPVYKMLMEAGEKRMKEADAIKKITWAGASLKEPFLLEYDSLMIYSKNVHQYFSESLEVIEPYRGENKDIHAWNNLLKGK